MTVLIIGGAYQGKRKVAENLYVDLPRIENLHEIVRKMLKEDKDPMSLADTLVTDEIGCGIVPIDRADENWREAVGRLCCALAQKADAVVRVIAGVPQFIKGEQP